MKQSEKFTPEYRKKLKANIKKMNLIPYLESRTGYKFQISTVLDKELGYLYSCKLSLDNFESYSKYLIQSTGKTNIKNEILSAVSKFDFKFKKRGGTIRQLTKIIGSSSLKIDCLNCGENPVLNFHRNKSSQIFLERGGYYFLCFSCIYKRAIEIMQAKNMKTSIAFLCGQFDRPYLDELAERVIKMELSPIEKFGRYFKHLNLVKQSKKIESTFASSDIFERLNQNQTE